MKEIAAPFHSGQMLPFISFFFFNDTATTEIYTLSLHDALPIYLLKIHDPDKFGCSPCHQGNGRATTSVEKAHGDRKSTRLNSSHGYISYAVFCLKKKNTPPSRRPSAQTHPRPDSPHLRAPHSCP